MGTRQKIDLWKQLEQPRPQKIAKKPTKRTNNESDQKCPKCKSSGCYWCLMLEKEML